MDLYLEQCRQPAVSFDCCPPDHNPEGWACYQHNRVNRVFELVSMGTHRSLARCQRRKFLTRMANPGQFTFDLYISKFRSEGTISHPSKHLVIGWRGDIPICRTQEAMTWWGKGGKPRGPEQRQRVAEVSQSQPGRRKFWELGHQDKGTLLKSLPSGVAWMVRKI